jgi:hypothetical protein
MVTDPFGFCFGDFGFILIGVGMLMEIVFFIARLFGGRQILG